MYARTASKPSLIRTGCVPAGPRPPNDGEPPANETDDSEDDEDEDDVMAAAGTPSARIDGSPGPRDKALCAVYAIIAAGALIATWSQNIRFFTQDDNGGLGGFLRDAWANPAAASLSNDVVFVALAAAVFMVVEARRLGIRHVWIFLAGSLLVAISVALPLFLLVRQRVLATARTTASVPPS